MSWEIFVCTVCCLTFMTMTFLCVYERHFSVSITYIVFIDSSKYLHMKTWFDLSINSILRFHLRFTILFDANLLGIFFVRGNLIVKCAKTGSARFASDKVNFIHRAHNFITFLNETGFDVVRYSEAFQN